jgi:predicted molibdopterin-dependent oxidoreductase YjgC
MSTQSLGAPEAPGDAGRSASTPEVITVSFDGHPLEAEPGQSVGAALAARGIMAWRSTRKGARPRGIFCGIGVCYDCLVTVDGAANERACLVEVREGMQIKGSCPQPEGSPS